MVARNWPIKDVLWKIPLRFLLDAMSAWKSLIQGHPLYWLGVFEAHIHFILWLFKNTDKVGWSGKTNKPQGVLHTSIVWQYFFRGRRYFSQIVQRK
jgi:hypothetical protein